MTHHVGYTLLFEQALQLVNPAVSIPYWEYTLEGETVFYWFRIVWFGLVSIFFVF